MEHLRQEAARAKKLGLTKRQFFAALTIEFLLTVATMSFYMWVGWDMLKKLLN